MPIFGSKSKKETNTLNQDNRADHSRVITENDAPVALGGSTVAVDESKTDIKHETDVSTEIDAGGSIAGGNQTIIRTDENALKALESGISDATRAIESAADGAFDFGADVSERAFSTVEDLGGDALELAGDVTTDAIARLSEGAFNALGSVEDISETGFETIDDVSARSLEAVHGIAAEGFEAFGDVSERNLDTVDNTTGQLVGFGREVNEESLALAGGSLDVVAGVLERTLEQSNLRDLGAAETIRDNAAFAERLTSDVLNRSRSDSARTLDLIVKAGAAIAIVGLIAWSFTND